MRIIGSGNGIMGVLAVALVAACAKPIPTPVEPSATPTAEVLAPPAVATCSFRNSEFLPGAAQFISSCEDTLEIRDVASGTLRAQRVVSGSGQGLHSIQRLVVSPDGTRLAVVIGSYEREVELRELPSLALIKRGAAPSEGVRFSANGKQVLMSDANGEVSALSAVDGRSVTPAEPKVAERWRYKATSRDGTRVVGVEERTVTIWNALSDKALVSFELPPDARGEPQWLDPFVSIDTPGALLLVDAQNPKRRFELAWAPGTRALEVSRDGRSVRAASRDAILEWQLGTPQPTVLLTDQGETLLGPSGTRAELSGGSFALWSSTAEGDQLVRRFARHPYWLELLPEGEALACDYSACLFVPRGGAAPAEYRLSKEAPPKYWAIEPGGKRLALSDGKQAHILDARTMVLEKTLALPPNAELRSFRATRPELLVTDETKLLGVSLADGKATPLQDLEGSSISLDASPDGEAIARVAHLGERSEVQVIRAGGGAVEREPLPSPVELVRFAPDGAALWLLQRAAHHKLNLELPVGAPGRIEPFGSSKEGCAAWSREPAGARTHQCIDAYKFQTTPKGNGVPVYSPTWFSLRPEWTERGLALRVGNDPKAPPALTLAPGAPPPPSEPSAPPPKPEPFPTLPLWPSDIAAWAWSQDRSTIAVLDSAGVVTTLSTRSGALMETLSESAGSLLTSEDHGALAILAKDRRSLELWDARNWQLLVRVPVTEGIDSVTMAIDGSRLAIVNGNGELAVVTADRSVRRYALRTDMAVRGVAFDPSGAYLALGGLPLRILRLSDGATLYGYAAAPRKNDTPTLLWLSEQGMADGELSTLELLKVPSPDEPGVYLGPGKLMKRAEPKLLEKFLGR